MFMKENSMPTENKETKKCYTQLYNKSYLLDIQRKEERFKREKNRINLNTATLLNSNYWRIEGIKNIYTIFYKNVSEVFGRDVAEFDLPKNLNKEQGENVENQKEEIQKKEETPTTDSTPKVDKGEKDETPKTGTVDIIGYVLGVTLLTGVGIVELKKRLK